MVHHLKLATVPFNAIMDGSKTIESRLFDEKRQKIAVGDEIIFTNREDIAQTVKVKVINLHRAATFHELFTQFGPAKFGGESIKWLDEQINEFYTVADQEKYGTVGIEFYVMQP